MSPQEPSPSASGQNGKKRKIHHFHRHGDLELRSTEGTIFRVYSAQLADASSVFSDMLAIGNADSPTTTFERKINLPSQPIEPDISTSILELFLEMIPVMYPRLPDPSKYLDVLQLFEFCLKFDVDERILDPIRTKLKEEASLGYQWSLLLWSGGRQNVLMAREALKAMTTESFVFPRIPVDGASKAGKHTKLRRATFSEALKMLPPLWQLELLHLTLEAPEENSNSMSKSRPPGYSMEVTHNWPHVAKSFDPRSG